MEPIFPHGLRPGDTIAVVAPARYLDRVRIELAKSRLEAMGYRVSLPEDLYRKRGYLAGDDRERAAELMAAFRDREVKAVFPGTGGYGTTRMLDRLDYDVIRQNPKILLGFSDITALHLAIQRKTGLVTFHGPLLMFGLGSAGNLSDFSAEYLWRALRWPKEAAGGQDPPPPGYVYVPPETGQPIKTLSSGVGRGRLTGGNLSLVAALMGTPYEIETDGRVLFLEDTHEEPYRIDRYLSQLRLAGKFDKPAGVILGIFSDSRPTPGKESLTLEEVFRDYFEECHVPVIMNFPAGHTPKNATLPFNTLVELDADRGRLTVLENPVR